MNAEPSGGASPVPTVECEPVVEVSFSPQGRHPALPLEVFDMTELLERIPAPHLGRPQRADFQLLLLCVAGTSSHVVDFVEYPLSPGSAIRIHPGQTHQYVDLGEISGYGVIWRADRRVEEPGGTAWFPGGPEPTRFLLAPDTVERVARWIAELRTEQDRFDGSPRRIDLMRTILRALLLLVEEAPGGDLERSGLPTAYVELRQMLERDLYERPSIQRLARQLGYSSRTLDRACKSASGQTAREVVDERLRLELRRTLADESIPIARIRHSFGFHEATNFAKFVRRLLGRSPGEFRRTFEQ